jgi:hypothetical protein
VGLSVGRTSCLVSKHIRGVVVVDHGARGTKTSKQVLPAPRLLRRRRGAEGAAAGGQRGIGGAWEGAQGALAGEGAGRGPEHGAKRNWTWEMGVEGVRRADGELRRKSRGAADEFGT